MIVQFIETGKFEPFEYELDLDEEMEEGENDANEITKEEETEEEDDSEGEVKPDDENDKQHNKLRKTEL
mgnify:FL=1